jgi:hypothetical protein
MRVMLGKKKVRMQVEESEESEEMEESDESDAVNRKRIGSRVCPRTEEALRGWFCGRRVA